MTRKLRNRCKRNVNRKSLFCLYIVSWLLVGYAKKNEVCGKFRIETFSIKDKVLYVEENTNVNITFTIITNTKCKAFTDIRIDVSKLNNASAIDSKIFVPQCTIWLGSNMCRGYQNSNIHCMCLITNAHYSYSVMKEVTASDITKWKLSTEDNIIEDLIIDFRKTVKTTESSELQDHMYDVTSTLEITQTEHTITLFSSAMLETTSVNSEFSSMSSAGFIESNDKNVTVIIIYVVGSAIFVAVVTGIIACIIVMKIYRKANTRTGMNIDQSSNEHLDTPNRPTQDNRRPRCIEIGPNVEATLFIKGCPGTSLQTQNDISLNPDLTLVPFERPKVEDYYYIDICE